MRRHWVHIVVHNILLALLLTGCTSPGLQTPADASVVPFAREDVWLEGDDAHPPLMLAGQEGGSLQPYLPATTHMPLQQEEPADAQALMPDAFAGSAYAGSAYAGSAIAGSDISQDTWPVMTACIPNAPFTCDWDGNGRMDTLTVRDDGKGEMEFHIKYASGQQVAIEIDLSDLYTVHILQNQHAQPALLVSGADGETEFRTFVYRPGGAGILRSISLRGYLIVDEAANAITLRDTLELAGSWNASRAFVLDQSFALQPAPDSLWLLESDESRWLSALRPLPYTLTDAPAQTSLMLAGTMLLPYATDAAGSMYARLQDGTKIRIAYAVSQREEILFDGWHVGQAFSNIQYAG